MTPPELYKSQLTPEITNAIINCFEKMWATYAELQRTHHGNSELSQMVIEEELWTHFLYQKVSEFKINGRYIPTSVNVLGDSSYTWYQKLDIVEYTIKYIDEIATRHSLKASREILNSFIYLLNYEFKRLDYAYRVVNNEIVEVSSEEEIQAITDAINDSKDNVKEHLSKALEHYGERPSPDVRNSIKESISAVEAVCREFTGEQTLGKALKKLEDKGLVLHPMLKESIIKLYVYTNDQTTGIRHALMDSTATYVPSTDEAYYMLISCSMFINYLRRKIASLSSPIAK